MSGVVSRLPQVRFGAAGAGPAGHGGLGWQIVGEPNLLPGHLYASHYPSLLLRLRGPALTAAQRDRVGADLAARLGGLTAPEAGDGDEWEATLDWVLSLVDALQQACALPVVEAPRVLDSARPEARVQVPACSRSLAPLVPLLGQLMLLLAPLARGETPQQALAQLGALHARLEATTFKGGNTPRFVRAAHAEGIPFREMPGQLFRFGIGRRGRWLNSSYTEDTGHIAAQVARDKLISGAMLTLAGIPVPQRQIVTDPDNAIAVAQAFGYPVVIKPADNDGGRGVAAGLETPAEVRQAFAEASRHSRRILLEKHVHGRDYRLTVYRERLVWAIERVPAGVTGNGQDSVAALVARVNADPRRGKDLHSPLKAIVLDAEADHLLARQSLSRDAVPAEGRFVRLKRIANVGTGGMPIAALDEVHPENARLAVAAARALRLDLAGIDLLIPDITRSWREVGAAICEVNGQPQLGGTTAMHLYPAILHEEVGGNGRIPTLLVWGGGDGGGLLPALEAALSARGLAVGWHDRTGVRVGDELLAPAGTGPLPAGEMLAGDPRVDVLVLTIEDARVLSSGLPLARFDLVLDSGARPEPREAPQGLPPERCEVELARAVLGACDGAILAGEALAGVLARLPAGTAAPIEPLATALSGASVEDRAEALAARLGALHVPD